MCVLTLSTYYTQGQYPFFKSLGKKSVQRCEIQIEAQSCKASKAYKQFHLKIAIRKKKSLFHVALGHIKYNSILEHLINIGTNKLNSYISITFLQNSKQKETDNTNIKTTFYKVTTKLVYVIHFSWKFYFHIT